MRCSCSCKGLKGPRLHAIFGAKNSRCETKYTHKKGIMCCIAYCMWAMIFICILCENHFHLSFNGGRVGVPSSPVGDSSRGHLDLITQNTSA